MRTVTVRLPAAEFSAAMAAMREWLDQKHYVPALFRYEQEEEAVVVSVEFRENKEGRAFATRFDGAEGIPPTPPQL